MLYNIHVNNNYVIMLFFLYLVSSLLFFHVAMLQCMHTIYGTDMQSCLTDLFSVLVLLMI